MEASLTEYILIEGASVGQVESPVEAGLIELILAKRLIFRGVVTLGVYCWSSSSLMMALDVCKAS